MNIESRKRELVKEFSPLLEKTTKVSKIWMGVLIAIILHISNNKKIMGVNVNGRISNILGFMALIIIMTVCFCINMVAAEPSYKEIALGTLIPSVPSGAWPAALGLVGAVIMPHNMYLHSSLVLTRKIDHKNRNAVHEANIYNAIESAFSLGISFFISTAVIATFAVYIVRNPSAGGDDDLDL